MPKILFFPQNETHLDNFIPIEKHLINRNWRTFYLDTTKLYYQKLNFGEKCNVVKVHNLEIETPFYKLSAQNKLRQIFKLRKHLAPLVGEYDGFVFGSDGAFQRIIINEARRLQKPTFLILDAMISDYTFSVRDIFLYSKQKLRDFKIVAKEKARIWVSQTFRYSSLNPLLPSVAGLSGTNFIFCIGPHTKQVLEKFHEKTEIIDSGLPRYVQVPVLSTSKPNANRLKICYFTGSFKWHNQWDNHQAQKKDLNLLIRLIQKLNNEGIKTELHIKVHPREDIRDYDEYLESERVFIRNDISVEECFYSMDLFFSMISTCIIEGMLYDKIVYSVLINAPTWKFKNSFLFDEGIRVIDSKHRLEKLIREHVVKHFRPIVKKHWLYRFFSEDTRKSPSLIADIIANECTQR